VPVQDGQDHFAAADRSRAGEKKMLETGKTDLLTKFLFPRKTTAAFRRFSDQGRRHGVLN